MINDNEHHQQSSRSAEADAIATIATGSSSARRQIASPNGPSDPAQIKENVRATLTPLPGTYVGRSSMSAESGRSSVDTSKKSYDAKRSTDANRTFRRPSHEARRSFNAKVNDKQSNNRLGDRSPLSAKPRDSSESASNSIEPETESSAAVCSLDESNVSASQILSRSDVFRALPIHPTNTVESANRHSQDTTRSYRVNKPHLKSADPSRNKGRGISGNTHLPLGSLDMEDEAETSQTQTRLSTSSTALQDIATYPLQKASGLAGFLRTRSKRMGNLLASESMGYYEKVSGMLAGGRKHYNTAEGLEPGDQVPSLEEDEDAVKAAENFREHFAFPETEQLQSSYFTSLQRIFPTYGKIYISDHYFCFRSLMPTSKTKVSSLPCSLVNC
jgi:sterol 3beta-glucosyltransferase